jgi:hypothetical protein
MAMTVLSPNSVFSPGARLWIAADFAQSSWTQKLDWYLNFQISRYLRHTKASPSEFTQWVWQQTQYPAIDIASSKTAPLMIASKDLLPTDWVVVVPLASAKDFSSWAGAVVKVWQDLQNPELRIFLPKDVPTNLWGSFWEEQKNSANCSLVTSL